MKVVLYVNRFPKNTKLYKLMTTKLGELIYKIAQRNQYSLCKNVNIELGYTRPNPIAKVCQIE